MGLASMYAPLMSFSACLRFAILLAVWPVDPVVAALKALDRGC